MAGMDFITGLPAVLFERQMVDAILVVTDAFSKMLHLFPLSTAATAEDVTHIYHDGIYKHHGMQSSIISDRDPKFTGGFWKAGFGRLSTLRSGRGFGCRCRLTPKRTGFRRIA
jgi:hypothetical protein